MIPLYERAAESARFINSKSAPRSPRIAIVLGSGLGSVADAMEGRVEVPYDEVPHFARSTVEGHAGKLVIGAIAGIDAVVMQGRFHLYEGYSMDEVTLPVRAFSMMGIRSLILTNAAGSTSTHLTPGKLMLITDHINLTGDNPLAGPNDDRFGPRFPDMTHVYTPAFIDLAHESARQMGFALAEGVYAGLRGPSYETPAEVRMLRTLGADAVGMSTVPEAIAARHSGMKVLGLSCITNIAAGLSRREIKHAEVMEVGAKTGERLSELILRLVPQLVTHEVQVPLSGEK